MWRKIEVTNGSNEAEGRPGVNPASFSPMFNGTIMPSSIWMVDRPRLAMSSSYFCCASVSDESSETTSSGASDDSVSTAILALTTAAFSSALVKSPSTLNWRITEASAGLPRDWPTRLLSCTWITRRRPQSV